MFPPTQSLNWHIMTGSKMAEETAAETADVVNTPVVEEEPANTQEPEQTQVCCHLILLEQ